MAIIIVIVIIVVIELYLTHCTDCDRYQCRGGSSGAPVNPATPASRLPKVLAPSHAAQRHRTNVEKELNLFSPDSFSEVTMVKNALVAGAGELTAIPEIP